jgi:hypothetical protein
MKTYTFTLEMSGASVQNREIEDALFEAGCDDATLVSQNGVLFLDFDREAESLTAAITSAIAAVERSPVGLRVVRVLPDDFVSISEIARRVKRTRQSVQQLAAGTRGPGDFPPPVSHIKGYSPLWRWSDVLKWWSKAFQDAQSEPEHERIDTIGGVNAVLDMRRYGWTLKGAAEMLKAISE